MAAYSPPLEWYSRKPVVVLPCRSRRERERAARDRASAAEQGRAGEKEPSAGGTGAGEEEEEDNLDMHVEDVLRKRDRFRRVMRGVWSFVKTRTYALVWGDIQITDRFEYSTRGERFSRTRR